MNDTKWDELRLAMHGLGDLRPRWRARDVNGVLSAWDRDWYYHLRDGGYASIEWVEIETLDPAADQPVLEHLRRIHLPGHRTERGYRIHGYVPPGTPIDWIR